MAVSYTNFLQPSQPLLFSSFISSNSSSSNNDNLTSSIGDSDLEDDAGGFPEGLDAEDFDYAFRVENLSWIGDDWTDDRAHLPALTVYFFTFFIGVIGNLFVIVVLAVDNTSRSVTSTILVSLAAADVTFLAVCVPYEMLTKHFFIWSGGAAFCKIAAFVETLAATASVLNLTAVSIERYAVIVHPVRSRSWCCTSNSHKFAVAVWATSLFTSTPVLYVMTLEVGLLYDSQSHSVVRTCGNRYAEGSTRDEGNIRGAIFAWYQMSVIFLLPLIAMLYCYSRVIVELWFSTKELAILTHMESSGSNVRTSKNAKQKKMTGSRVSHASQSQHHVTADLRPVRRQVIKMLLTIVILFFIFWGPKWIINTMKHYRCSILVKTSEAFYITLAANLLPYVQSCINPIIYCFMSTNFRRSVRDTFRCLRSLGRPQRHLTGSHLTGVDILPMNTTGGTAKGPSARPPSIHSPSPPPPSLPPAAPTLPSSDASAAPLDCCVVPPLSVSAEPQAAQAVPDALPAPEAIQTSGDMPVIDSTPEILPEADE